MGVIMENPDRLRALKALTSILGYVDEDWPKLQLSDASELVQHAVRFLEVEMAKTA